MYSNSLFSTAPTTVGRSHRCPHHWFQFFFRIMLIYLSSSLIFYLILRGQPLSHNPVGITSNMEMIERPLHVEMVLPTFLWLLFSYFYYLLHMITCSRILLFLMLFVTITLVVLIWRNGVMLKNKRRKKKTDTKMCGSMIDSLYLQVNFELNPMMILP